MDVLQRARLCATTGTAPGLRPLHGSFQQPLKRPMSRVSESGDSEAFFKEKYIQGMEERLHLHSQIAAKDAELMEKATALEQVMEYASRLEMEIAALDAVSYPTEIASTAQISPISKSHDQTPLSRDQFSDMQIDATPAKPELPPPSAFYHRSWIDLVRQRHAGFSTDPSTCESFVQSFLKKNGIQETMVTSVYDQRSSFGIPLELEDIFLGEFAARFINESVVGRPSRHHESVVTPAPSLISKNQPLSNPIRSTSPSTFKPTYHDANGTPVTIWTEFIRTFLKDEAIQALLKDHGKLKRARNGLSDFLSKRLPTIGLTMNGIKILKQLTIPKSLEREFKAWFKFQYEKDFMDFSQVKMTGEGGPNISASYRGKNNHISSSRNSSSQSSSSKKRKSEQAHSGSVKKAPRPYTQLSTAPTPQDSYTPTLDPSLMTSTVHVATEKVLEEGIAVPSSLMEAAASESSMIRYNLLLKSIMPQYNTMPKPSRMEIKSRVKQYLLGKLGGEEQLSTCVMWAKANNQLFSTYGIPKDLEMDFKNWAIKELRREFGQDQVPLTAWEC